MSIYNKFQVACNFTNNANLLEIYFKRFVNRNHLAGFDKSEKLMPGNTLKHVDLAFTSKAK